MWRQMCTAVLPTIRKSIDLIRLLQPVRCEKPVLAFHICGDAYWNVTSSSPAPWLRRCECHSQFQSPGSEPTTDTVFFFFLMSGMKYHTVVR